MPTGTQFRPTHENAFNSDAQRVNIQSVQTTIEPNETKNIDLQLSDDHLLQGLRSYLSMTVTKTTRSLSKSSTQLRVLSYRQQTILCSVNL